MGCVSMYYFVYTRWYAAGLTRCLCLTCMFCTGDPSQGFGEKYDEASTQLYVLRTLPYC